MRHVWNKIEPEDFEALVEHVTEGEEQDGDEWEEQGKIESEQRDVGAEEWDENNVFLLFCAGRMKVLYTK